MNYDLMIHLQLGHRSDGEPTYSSWAERTSRR